MAPRSRRGTVLLFGVAVPLSAGLTTFLIGPRYLQPLPAWAKLAVLAACCCVIGVTAIYTRSRTRSA